MACFWDTLSLSSNKWFIEWSSFLLIKFTASVMYVVLDSLKKKWSNKPEHFLNLLVGEICILVTLKTKMWKVLYNCDSSEWLFAGELEEIVFFGV